MAYVSKEKKAKIAAALKIALKDSDVKYTLAVRNHMDIVCTVKSAPIDFIANMNQTCGANHYQVSRGFTPVTSGHVVVNEYHYDNHFSGTALSIIKKILACLNIDNYDNSDVQTDYFDRGHYVTLQFGRWDTSFVYLPK